MRVCCGGSASRRVYLFRVIATDGEFSGFPELDVCGELEVEISLLLGTIAV
jgi:hypothetical protein